MSNSFNMYPVLTPEMTDTAGVKAETFEFMYNEGREIYPLNITDISQNENNISAAIEDPRCEWYPEKYNLGFSYSISIEHPSAFFGKDGIASRKSILGIAIRWMSVRSEHRGVIHVGDFSCTETELTFTVNHKFAKSVLKGSLVLETILYLKAYGDPDFDEGLLASSTGTVFGTINTREIFIDGNGSVFPIATVSDPSKPLWWVYYDSLDPLLDPFDDEYVEIRLNRAHPAFELLKIDSSFKESTLFLEILSSALLIIVESVQETLGPDWYTVLSGQQFARGSVAEVIYHFVIKLGWDTSSPAELSQSIHSFLDNNIKGGS